MNVVILRGLPGSGKSTYAKGYSAAQIVSADDHFVGDDGVYRFDPSQLPKAHQACFQWFLDVIEAACETVIVANTNVHAYEIAPYLVLAEAHGYEVEIHQMECDLETAFGRQVHGVPKYAMLRMYAEMSAEKLPPWWRVVKIASKEARHAP